MEYVGLSVSRPSWLNLSLPQEVADLLRLDPKTSNGVDGGRSVSFLARGAGILRVVPTGAVREALAVETLRHRLVATARLTDKLLLNLPVRVAQHLRLETVVRPSGARGTDDLLLWLVPAPEYYPFRRGPDVPKGAPATVPPDAPLPHVYLVRSLLPVSREVGALPDLESRIEQEEWAPAVEALQKVGRGRRPAV